MPGPCKGMRVECMQEHVRTRGLTGARVLNRNCSATKERMEQSVMGFRGGTQAVTPILFCTAASQ
eukprot:1136787-Pelagomonas_calceolata.AAC.8